MVERRRRGEPGSSRWSGFFIDAVESITVRSRLQRGRSYARLGHVGALEIRPGEVRALVSGRRERPYAVTIHVPVFTEGQWKAIEEILREGAGFAAALQAGEVPHEIELELLAEGISLFPDDRYDFQTRCTCPDPVNPCKHVAAVVYVLAERFDRDPWLIFEWRGRERAEVLAALAGGEAEEATEMSVLPADPEHFWRAGSQVERLHFHPRAPDLPEALIVKLGTPPPEAGGEALADALAAAYRAAAKGAEAMKP